MGVLIGKTEARQAVRRRLLAEGYSEGADGKLHPPGAKNRFGGIPVESTETPLTPASPELQAKSDSQFGYWAERAKKLNMPVEDPIDIPKRIEYMFNNLLPALARAGDVEAMMQLAGFSLNTGFDKTAHEYFVMAAEYGHLEAPWYAAMNYEFGRGVEIDLVRAYAWALLAQSGLPVETAESLERLRT